MEALLTIIGTFTVIIVWAIAMAINAMWLAGSREATFRHFAYTFGFALLTVLAYEVWRTTV